MVIFRQTFDFSKISKELYQWFPGHMAKGLKKMYFKTVLSSCDRCVKELANTSKELKIRL